MPRSFDPTPVLLPAGPQTVIVAGDLAPVTGTAVARLASEAGIPLLAEPSSNARVGAAAIGTYRVLLDSSLAEDVERVVVFGHPTLSRPVLSLLGRDDIELIMVSPTPEWIDPQRRANLVADAVEFESVDGDWLPRWCEADRLVRSELDFLLSGQSFLSGPQLAGSLWTGSSADDVWMLGSSSPIRDLDLAPITQGPPTVYANRGLAGIDGTVSTAIGVAIALERPVHALVGDETFLHDLTGLIVGGSETRPDVRLVVANDNGGSIFATLEHGRPAYSGSYERLFGTPHDVAVSDVAAALGATSHRVRTLADLAPLLRSSPSGIEVVEVLIDRSQRRNLDTAITGLAASL